MMPHVSSDATTFFLPTPRNKKPATQNQSKWRVSIVARYSGIKYLPAWKLTHQEPPNRSLDPQNGEHRVAEPRY